MKPDNFLNKILESKKVQVQKAKSLVPQKELQKLVDGPMPTRRGFFAALSKPGPKGANIIAEIKRASPSKGLIRPDLNPADIAVQYSQGGAAALSVLTETQFFLAQENDLALARQAVNLPVLRKDFIVDEYQIWETTALGADAFLLIVAAISDEFLRQSLDLGRRLKIDALVEVHDSQEMERALAAGAGLVGINNRNLKTFETDLAVTEKLALLLPQGVTAVCESGIRGIDDIRRIQQAGVFNFLVGESLMRAQNPGAALGELLGDAP
jgi:indole-3-glycerol phosphate synthase